MPLVVAAVVFGLVLFAAWPAAHRQFALDDILHLGTYPAKNRNLGLAQVIGLRHWQAQTVDFLWRPVPKVLWWELQRLGWLTPPILTIISALLAAVCAGLFYSCFRYAHSGFRLLVILCAVLPLLNSLAADVLLPFVGQMDLLAAACVLGAWVAFQRIATWRLLAGGLLLLAAFHSKESSWPAVLALPAVTWLGGGSRRRRNRTALVVLGVSGAMMALHFGLRYAITGRFISASGGAGTKILSGERHVSIAECVGRYVAAFALPFLPQTDYSFLKQPGSSASFYPWLGGAVLILLPCIFYLLLRKTPATRRNANALRARRRMIAGLIWTILFLMPFIGIVPLGALWAGRFAFLPMFGIAMFLYALATLFGLWLLWLILAYLVLVVGCGVIAVRHRAHDWVSPSVLWKAEVQRVPQHAFAWKNHAVYLQRSSRPADAYGAITRATELWPTFVEGWIAQGQIAWGENRITDAEKAFLRAERLMPGDAEIQVVLARFAAAQGRFQTAIERLRIVLQRDPGNADAKRLLDRVLKEPSFRKSYPGAAGEG